MTANEAFHPGPYIRISKEFYEDCFQTKTDIINILLTVVAFTVKTDHKNKPLVVDKKACLGRTKRYIANKATQYIREINYNKEEPCTIQRFVSKTQLNNLIQKRSTKITCFGTIIAYVILLEISRNKGMDELGDIINKKRKLGGKLLSWFDLVLENCCEVVRNTGEVTHDDHPFIDELIDFFLECARVINKTVGSDVMQISNKEYIEDISPKSMPCIPVLRGC